MAIGLTILHMGGIASSAKTQPSVCPAGVPAQAITVVNQANIQPWTLAKVERALVDQSIQLRAAWGTPCVQFEDHGWPLYLEPDVHGWAVHYFVGDTGLGWFQDNTACSHRPDTSLPCALISVGQNWTINTSHELLEMLANPNGIATEVCDPVVDSSYRLDGVWVSDFVFPNTINGHRDQMATLD